MTQPGDLLVISSGDRLLFAIKRLELYCSCTVSDTLNFRIISQSALSCLFTKPEVYKKMQIYIFIENI